MNRHSSPPRGYLSQEPDRVAHLVAVPAAALLGKVIFAVVAPLVAVVIALADGSPDGLGSPKLGDLGWTPSSDRRRDDDDRRRGPDEHR